ncbi:MAG: hypothetical protein AB8I08_16405 [Sandaracinaceae bacterium]
MTELLDSSAEERMAVRELAQRPIAHLPVPLLLSFRTTVASRFFDDYEAIEIRRLERSGKHAKALRVFVDAFALLRDRTLLWGDVPGRLFASVAFGPARDAICVGTGQALQGFLEDATRVAMPKPSATLARMRLLGPALCCAEDREELLEGMPESLHAVVKAAMPTGKTSPAPVYQSPYGFGTVRAWWDAAETLLSNEVVDASPTVLDRAIDRLEPDVRQDPRRLPHFALLKWVRDVSLDRLRTEVAWQTLLVVAALRLVSQERDEGKRPWLARALARLSEDFGFVPRSDVSFELARGMDGRPALRADFTALASLPEHEKVDGMLSRVVYVDGKAPTS